LVTDMTRLFAAATIALTLFIMALAPNPAQAAEYGYIDLTNPFLRKMPLAMPWFKITPESADNRRAADRTADLLRDTLTFSGYFKFLDRETYLVNPDDPPVLAQQVQFADWTGIGAELLITGGFWQRGDAIDLELRLFDTFQGKLLVGKKYTSRPGDLRRVVRRFAGDVIFELTGKRGVFQSQLAFVSTGTGVKEIYICDFDGYAPRQFTFHRTITLFPAWSGDCQWLAYTSYAKERQILHIRHLTDHRGYTLDVPGIAIPGDWAPDRFELAATLSLHGDQEIYVLTGQGKITKRLTTKPGIDVSPSWSPDGKKIAFVSNRSGSPQIYIMDVETGTERRLTYEGQYNTQPDWSPNGDKIAYAGVVDGHQNIYTIGLDDQPPVQLTADSGDNESPSWSPDGSLIAFGSTREGASRIYVMTAFGTDQRRLLALPGEQSQPRWSPNVPHNQALSGS